MSLMRALKLNRVSSVIRTGLFRFRLQSSASNSIPPNAINEKLISDKEYISHPFGSMGLTKELVSSLSEQRN
jgi:hypothetical protein